MLTAYSVRHIFVNLRANIAKGERNGKTGNRRFACLDTAEPHLYYTNIKKHHEQYSQNKGQDVQNVDTGS